MNANESELKFLNNINSKYYKVIAGATAVIITLMIFSVSNMLGNGKYIFAGLDSEHQYYPYIKYLIQVLKENADYCFSWSNGLGQGMNGILAYYTLSPINLLYLLFPAEKFISATVLVFCVKIFLSAMIMQMFLSYFLRNRRIGTIIFAVCYALCGYQIIYFFLVNLADAVYILPLIMYGIVKLIREKKANLLLFSYLLLFSFNFYMGYILGINSFIIGFAYYLYTFKNRDKKSNHFIVLNYISTVIVSIFATAIVWLPAVLQLKQLGEKDFSSYTARISNDPILTLNNLFCAQFQSFDGYIPYIYCSLAVFILSILFFLNKSISIRKKKYFASLIVIYLIIMCVQPLNYLMHAFDTTQMLGFRYSFVFSFILCIVSCIEIVNIRNNTKNDFLIAALILAALYVIGYFDYFLKYNKFNSNSGIDVIFFNLVLIILYFVIFGLLKNKKENYFYWKILLYILFSLDIFISYVFVIKRMDIFKFEDTYNNQIALERNTVEALPKCEMCDFYRMQGIDLQVLNVGIQDSFNNISSFSTFSHGSMFELFKNMGIEIAPHMNTSRGMYEIMRSILGVKYYTNFEIENSNNIKWFLRDENNLAVDSFHQNYGIGSAVWEENDKNLSIGFMADEDIMNIDICDSPFDNLDNLISALCGEPIDCYSNVQPNISFKNSMIIPANDFIQYDYNNKLDNVNIDDCNVVFSIFDNKEELYSEYNITSDSVIDDSNENYSLYNSCISYSFEDKGNPIYSYFTRDDGNHYQNYSTIYNLTNDESVSQYQFRPTQEMSEEYILKLGHNKNNQYELILYLDALDNYDYFNKNYFASFNKSEFEKAYSILSKNQLMVNEYSDEGYLKGAIESDKNGILFTSIPYSSGWRAVVDATDIKPIAICNNAFIGIPLNSGKHTIELTYVTPGLNTGIILTLIGIGLIIVIFGINKYYALLKK